MPKRKTKKAKSRRKVDRGERADLIGWIRDMGEREAHELASQVFMPPQPATKVDQASSDSETATCAASRPAQEISDHVLGVAMSARLWPDVQVDLEKALEGQSGRTGGFHECDIGVLVPGESGGDWDADGLRRVVGPPGIVELVARSADALVEAITRLVGTKARDIAVEVDDLVAEIERRLRAPVDASVVPAAATQAGTNDLLRRAKASVAARASGHSLVDSVFGGNVCTLKLGYPDASNDLLEVDCLRLITISSADDSVDRLIEGLVKLAISIDPSPRLTGDEAGMVPSKD